MPRSHGVMLPLLIAIVGALVVLVSLAGWTQVGWSSRNTVPFGHSTYAGGAMVLLLPWLVLRAVTTGRWTRVAWATTAVAALVVVASTSSRGAAVAVGAMIGLAVLSALIFAPWSRARKLLLAAAAVAIVVAAVMTNPRLRELALERRWGESARESNRQRSAMFAAGLKLGFDRPVFGWGPGTVPLAYPQLRAELDGGVENVLQLHNAPIQTWATLGGAGAAALLLIVAGAGAALARCPTTTSPAGRRLLVVAGASLGGYVLFSLTDHQFDLPLVAALAACNLAVFSSTAAVRCGPLARKSRLLFVLAGLVLIAGPAIALARDLLARHSYERGLEAWEAGRRADFIAQLHRAAEWAPHDPYYLHLVAGELLHTAAHAADESARLELSRLAIKELEASLAAGAHQELAHFNLGWLQLRTGDPAAAAENFTAAARLVPDKGGVYFGLGLALDASARRDDAIRAFALEWLNDPRQLTSPAWEVPALAALRPLIQAELLRLYAELRPRFSAAVTAEAWTRWWQEGQPAAAAELDLGFSSEALAFARALPAISARAPLDAPYPWAKLYTAWRDRDFRAVARGDNAFATALADRARRHGSDFRAFLKAGSEDEPALMRTFRRQRTGYGVLALHPDGPVFTDAYVVQENRLLADFAAGLFPPKGWLPGRFLLALLPADPR